MEVGVDGGDFVRVLLIADSPQSFSLTRQLLERSGCDCHFAESLEAAKGLLQLWQFDIVLSTHSAQSYTIQSLVGLLLGSEISLFTALLVEEGSWWLPILQFGKECYGPALPVGDFAHALSDLRKQVGLRRLALHGFVDPKHGKHERLPDS
jgi:hypothetical protein